MKGYFFLSLQLERWLLWGYAAPASLSLLSPPSSSRKRADAACVIVTDVDVGQDADQDEGDARDEQRESRTGVGEVIILNDGIQLQLLSRAL